MFYIFLLTFRASVGQLRLIGIVLSKIPQENVYRGLITRSWWLIDVIPARDISLPSNCLCSKKHATFCKCIAIYSEHLVVYGRYSPSLIANFKNKNSFFTILQNYSKTIFYVLKRHR